MVTTRLTRRGWVGAALLGLAFSAPLAAQAPESTADSAATAAFDPAAHDPWERYNRGMYRFNRGFDKVFLRPVARGYQRFTPPLLRQGVSNFFDNLQQPIVALNQLLQGRPKASAAALGRFALNSTFGVGGLFDPAAQTKLQRSQADFGQTFARWGWRQSRFFVLPIFGPSTLRDAFGKGVNSQFSPIDWMARKEGPQVSFIYGIDARTRALSAEAFLEGANDEYALVRDGYLQHRRCQIVDCSEELPDYLLPDYQFEIPDVDFDTIRR